MKEVVGEITGLTPEEYQHQVGLYQNSTRAWLAMPF